ncbi:MAG TPA: lysylphosphatidylglycerol synthase transmembrane domain-containing protein [Vicinamibacterales bacterium]|nr:lysylphosphatidylglycerol synthase transmembrane domain-containing protein [Vicinamibacterales bacterium]
MKSHVRTALVLLVAAGLVALFLRNVDLVSVASDIAHARPEWLALSLATAFINLAIRAYRWQYLLEPLGRTTFASAFRATAVGFAASTVLPARAGEVIRPYFLARTAKTDDRMSATGAFATIVVERVLDVITVLTLVASYVFVFGRDMALTKPIAFAWLKGIGAVGAAGAAVTLVVLFLLAGDPKRLGRATERLARVVPSFASAIASIVEKFARGLGAVRRPGRLFVALLWSFPLWLSIALGLWSVTRAFQLAVPFTGSFIVLAILVLGVAVPTPGAVGGFHAAFRYSTTAFFGAPDAAAVGAAIVAHLLSVGPSLLLGLLFAAQVGLNVEGLRRLARQAEHPA